jgi:hypothetical protein
MDDIELQVTNKNLKICPFGNAIGYSKGRDSSNESKYVTIGRFELEIWADNAIATKWKIYYSNKG